MLLDKPGRYLYKHHVDLYPAMRAFCSDYRYIVSGVLLALAAWGLTRPESLSFFGITR